MLARAIVLFSLGALNACGSSGGEGDAAASEAITDESPDVARGAPADTFDLNLLTTANGATVVSAGRIEALGLIDGNADDHSWKTDHPREKLPMSVVFELRAPTRLTAVGADNAGPRPGGVAGGAAREIAFEGSAAGPDEGYAPLGVVELQPDERKTVAVTHAAPVRWIKATVQSDHGGGTWAYLDEVVALGEQEPLPSDDGRFGGAYRAPGNVVYELVQEGTLLSGCYTGTGEEGGGSMNGSVSDGVARLQWIDGTNAEVHGTALVVIDSRGRLNGVWNRDRSRSALVGEREQGELSRCPGVETNPVKAALEASGEAILYGIYFDFDSDVLKPESEPVLRQVLDALHSSPGYVIDVEGHTDAVGSDDYNRDLSARRAQAVVAWLVNEEVDADRLTPVGKGESEPVASNDTADGRALNRRVELRRR